jgi:hypothetical protein
MARFKFGGNVMGQLAAGLKILFLASSGIHVRRKWRPTRQESLPFAHIECFAIETGYAVWRKVRRSFSGVDYSGYNRPQYFLISLDAAIKVFLNKKPTCGIP